MIKNRFTNGVGFEKGNMREAHKYYPSGERGEAERAQSVSFINILLFCLLCLGS